MLLYFVEGEESFLLDRVFEHRLQSDHAFNMCRGNFGRSYIEQICVQSISCNLSVFEGENRVLKYQLIDVIHPGPIAYTPISDCILFTSGSLLQSVRYSVVTINSSLKDCSAGVVGKGGLPIGKTASKKLNVSKYFLVNLN